MNIETRIGKYLRTTGTPPTRFGREAAGDPRLVFDMRMGRSFGRNMRIRLDQFLSQRGA